MEKHLCCFFCCFILDFWEQKQPPKCYRWLFLLVFLLFRHNNVIFVQFWCHLWNLHSILGGKHVSCFFRCFILDFCEPNYQKQPTKCHKWVEHATSRRKKMGFWLFLGGPNTVYDIRGSWRTHFKTRFTNIRNIFFVTIFSLVSTCLNKYHYFIANRTDM